MDDTPYPQGFVPYPPEVARGLAHQAFVLYKAAPMFQSNNFFPCALCTHENREEIDYQLLIDAAGPELRAAAGRDPDSNGPDRGRWAKHRFTAHRDKHLLPIIENAAMPAFSRMIHHGTPLPVEADKRERGYWYLIRAFAIHAEAMKGKKLMPALLALREMRAIDVEMIAANPMKPVAPTGPDEPPPEGFADKDEKLLAAFSKSRPRQPIEDIEETENGRNGTDANGTET